MALPTVFETQDAFHAAIPEGFREHYTEKDGKFTLQVDKPENIATGLAKNRDEFRTEKEKAVALLEKERKEWQAAFAGKTPDEIRVILDAQAKKETDDLQKRGNFDEVLKKKDDAHTKTADELRAQIKERDAQILSFKLTARVEKAALEGGINPAQLQRVIRDTERRFKLAENDKIEVLDSDGYPVSTTPEAFFKEVYKADENNAIFYLPSGAGGGGAAASAGNGNKTKTIKRDAFDALVPTERDARIKDGYTVVE